MRTVPVELALAVLMAPAISAAGAKATMLPALVAQAGAVLKVAESRAVVVRVPVLPLALTAAVLPVALVWLAWLSAGGSSSCDLEDWVAVILATARLASSRSNPVLASWPSQRPPVQHGFVASQEPGQAQTG